MSAREWLDKDFYRELGVSSSASAEEIKKAYRKLARDLHPDANAGDAKSEAKFKAVSEAYGVLSDQAKRKEYDEARRLFANGGAFSGGFGGGQTAGGFDMNDIFARAANQSGKTGGFGDIFGNLFNRSGTSTTTTRARRGNDVETNVRIDFVEAVKGATVPMRLSSPSTCGTCHGTGARPGTTPRTCPTCAGVGLITRNQGAFAFSEPCRDCRGTGRIIDDPCPECGGDGVSVKSRTLTVRIPAGVDDGQRIRLAGQGEPGLAGGPNGDLFVKVYVNPHPIFGRSGNDLTLTVPVTFPELALGTTLTVPTLDGKVTLKVPAGTTNGRTLRAKAKGITKRNGQTGDLLITLQVAVPNNMDAQAREALEAYAAATAQHDPRAHLNALVQGGAV